MRVATLVTHIPSGRLQVEEIISSAGGSTAEARVFRRMFDMDHVAALRENETLMAQFDRLAEWLGAAHDGPLPDALIYAHGQPLQYEAGTQPMRALSQRHPVLARVRRHYEVDQHNCGGLFWALDMARTLLSTGLSHSVAVIGGDSHIGLPMGDRYVPGCTLMGDAFCGLIVDAEEGGLQLGPIALRTHPQFARGRAGSAEEMGAFFAAHSSIVRDALIRAGFDWEGRTPLLPHNVNRLAWKMFCRETGLDEARVRLSLLPDIGHCYTSDPFLLLDRERTQLKPGQSCMLTSIGMGGFAGACQATLASTDVSPSHFAKELSSCLQTTPC